MDPEQICCVPSGTKQICTIVLADRKLKPTQDTILIYLSSLLPTSLCGLRLPQWDEVSVLDDRGKLIRTFEVCNVNQNSRQQDSWLATPFLFRQSAPRMFVTLRFSVRDCASLRTPSPTCRETLTLYYKQADSQAELMKTWTPEVRSNTGTFIYFVILVCLETLTLSVEEVRNAMFQITLT